MRHHLVHYTTDSSQLTTCHHDQYHHQSLTDTWLKQITCFNQSFGLISILAVVSGLSVVMVLLTWHWFPVFRYWWQWQWQTVNLVAQQAAVTPLQICRQSKITPEVTNLFSSCFLFNMAGWCISVSVDWIFYRELYADVLRGWVMTNHLCSTLLCRNMTQNLRNLYYLIWTLFHTMTALRWERQPQDIPIDIYF